MQLWLGAGETRLSNQERGNSLESADWQQKGVTCYTMMAMTMHEQTWRKMGSPLSKEKEN
jgi:hypothetical protein